MHHKPGEAWSVEALANEVAPNGEILDRRYADERGKAFHERTAGKRARLPRPSRSSRTQSATNPKRRSVARSSGSMGFRPVTGESEHYIDRGRWLGALEAMRLTI